jgi:hypothetical protein
MTILGEAVLTIGGIVSTAESILKLIPFIIGVRVKITSVWIAWISDMSDLIIIDPGWFNQLAKY